MDPFPLELNVISLNCWGLKYISTHHKERLREIGRRIASASPEYHIVGLQECWTQEDYRSIRQQTKHVLPYGKFYHSGIFGGGLAILSRWPIEESSMVRYPLNGRPTAFWRGDWYVGKGVACAKIRIGPNRKDLIEVFTTHLHAPYEKEPNDSYLCHRTAQAWEIAKLLRGASERGHLALALGDFNMIPLSLAHRIITTHSPAQDVWRVLHPDSSIAKADDPLEQNRRRPVPTADYNLSENGTTSDSVLNTWRWPKSEQKKLGPGKEYVHVPGDTLDPKGYRLDYIFASSGARDGLAGGWIVKEARVGMTERHPTLQCSVSDHFSVECTLQYHQDGHMSNQGTPTLTDKDAVNSGAFLSSPANSLYGAQMKNLEETSYLPIPTYDEILEVIEAYTIRERKQRRYRLYHFIVSLLISIACFIGVWWSPHNYVAFILMLISTLGLSAGVIDGLIGGLFVGSEIRALKEFEWEVRNTRAAAGGETGGDMEAYEAVKDW